MPSPNPYDQYMNVSLNTVASANTK